MRELLGECETESKMLQKRLFTGLDAEMIRFLDRTVVRVRGVRQGHVRRITPPKQPVSKKAIRETSTAKTAELAKTMNARNEENRQRLIAELDTAIGRLRGISRSLENRSL